MDIEKKIARAKAIAEFTCDLYREIENANRLYDEINDETPDWDKHMRCEAVEKAGVMREVIEWLLK